ncbi:hypothetical protein GF391_02680 [Candidatus Uhrbacteria bacterium]|nr:hypothetical protein [Candidatus Uhrbacteria bacterium]
MAKKKIVIISSIISAALLLFIIIFLATALSIGTSVKNNCNKAQSQFEGNCVEALIQTLEADFTSYADKNSAIWTLGQLGDDRALPLLESKFTGTIPEREKWNEGISQYELSKAINLLKGGFNLSAFIWR